MIVTDTAGDMLQVWSNDLFKAAEHRVRATPAGGGAAPRFSVPFFYNPSYSALIAPCSHAAASAESTTGESNSTCDADATDGGANSKQTCTPKYRAVSWGYFRQQRFLGDYSDRGQEIQIEDFKILP
jgi:isopenicillin N synthase-like dioxygenase